MTIINVRDLVRRVILGQNLTMSNAATSSAEGPLCRCMAIKI
jgi:hypothetical protein